MYNIGSVEAPKLQWKGRLPSGTCDTDGKATRTRTIDEQNPARTSAILEAEIKLWLEMHYAG